jgi:hypothetical protein
VLAAAVPASAREAARRAADESFAASDGAARVAAPRGRAAEGAPDAEPRRVFDGLADAA